MSSRRPAVVAFVCSLVSCSTEPHQVPTDPTPQRSLAPPPTGSPTDSAAATSTSSSSAEPVEPAEAIRVVSEAFTAEGWMDNRPGTALQVQVRLWGIPTYRYQSSHAPEWKELLLAEQASFYGRLVAAYFLCDQEAEARRFLTEHAHSANLRHRFNTAQALLLYVGRDARKTWAIDLLIDLIDSGSLDHGETAESESGSFPEGDRTDSAHSPLEEICWALGSMKIARAVPALIGVLEREPRTGGATFALGEIGDRRAIPVLMTILQQRSGGGQHEITALGKLRHRPAVPLLLDRLEHPTSSFSGIDVLEGEAILDALQLIADASAAPGLARYLERDHPDQLEAMARRVLIQLTSPDPVPELLQLLHREAYEPERAAIIEVLSRRRDRRAVAPLAELSTKSPSAYLRREAITGLGVIGDRAALMALADAFTASFTDLNAEWGWKVIPDFKTYFPAHIVATLEAATGQKLGQDGQAWRDWIAAHAPE